MADSHDKAPVAHFEAPEEHQSLGWTSISSYLKTRLPTLKPPMREAPNPFKALALLNRQQWLFFSVAFWGWTLDALDFFTVSLTTSELAEEFDKEISDITWGITLVLMLRSVGAITFGIASDRWGRKWPFIVNLLLFIALEIGTGFTQTYEQFLAVRALFGIAMGGLYGNAAATALEDCPKEARGIISGLLQQGYAFGYLLATAFARALVGTTSHGWRPFYWFAGCLPALVIVFRLFLPETNAFRERQALRAEMRGNVTSTFLSEGTVALKRHWMLLIYLVLLMAGFNFMSHGSQDLYPTMLERQFSLSKDAVTVTQVVANLGALTGGTLCGWASQKFGRRFSIIFISIIGGALLYPYTFVSNNRVMAAAFFEQFCVQGAWGVIPIHLMELSPGSIRTFTVGTAYQLGNLVSSASSTIESTIGERFPLPEIEEGVERYEYGKVICIFMGCVFAYTILVTIAGPENLGRDFDVEHDDDVREIAITRGGDRDGDPEKGSSGHV
ncbi:major facilitator superfamily domain-containing protein [Aspergillus cavernicola]|uniref:Major facilitator superfamily domain-containing protein n=1 Tax=Aspergillus cavernicola TaxID=176166 RepID=A0ABR4IC16_9EURO